MSVYISKVTYTVLYHGWGRAEANWLANHFPTDSVGENTRVYILEDELQDALERAKNCHGCDFFSDPGPSVASEDEDHAPIGALSPGEETMATHREITEKMAELLPKMIADEKKRKGGYCGGLDIEISW